MNLWTNKYKYDIFYNRPNRVDILDITYLKQKSEEKVFNKKWDALIIILSCNIDEKENIMIIDGNTYHKDKIMKQRNESKIQSTSNKSKITIFDDNPVSNRNMKKHHLILIN